MGREPEPDSSGAESTVHVKPRREKAEQPRPAIGGAKKNRTSSTMGREPEPDSSGAESTVHVKPRREKAEQLIPAIGGAKSSPSGRDLLDRMNAHTAIYERRANELLKAQLMVMEQMSTSMVQLKDLLSLQSEDAAMMKEFDAMKEKM